MQPYLKHEDLAEGDGVIRLSVRDTANSAYRGKSCVSAHIHIYKQGGTAIQLNERMMRQLTRMLEDAGLIVVLNEQFSQRDLKPPVQTFLEQASL